MNEIDLDVQKLVQQVETAFSDVPYPGDDAIVPLYDNKPHCDECTELAEKFRGKNWQLVPFETLFWERGSLPLFTTEAFRYYLPAFLRAELLHPSETDTLGENLYNLLTPPENENGDKMTRFLERLKGFNS